MKGFFDKGRKKDGLPPGSIVHIGDKEAQKPTIELTEYNQEECRQQELGEKDLDQISLRKEETVSWLNIRGLKEENVIKKIGKKLDLHPLILEDIADTEQRPKWDVYPDYIFLVVQVLVFNENTNTTRSEQVSILLGENYVITFQEGKERLAALNQRISNNQGIVRKKGSDYLTYALLDYIIDKYYISLDKLGEQIEILEDKLIDNPSNSMLDQVREYRDEIYFVRKTIWALRELVRGFMSLDNPLIDEEVTVYMKDVYDHIMEINDMILVQYDMIKNSLDIYMSSSSNEMNNIMQVLTIIATIFIPLTFIVGVYGMNFQYMPELKFRYGYPLVMVFMIIIAVALLWFFKRKDWL